MPSKKASTKWMDALQLAKQSIRNLESLERIQFITSLSVRMKEGIPVLDRFHFLKPYKRCFLGSEATSWIMEDRGCSLQEALLIGAAMIKLGIIYHVKREHFLCDKPYFYRFNSALAQLAAAVEGGGVFSLRCSCYSGDDLEEYAAEARRSSPSLSSSSADRKTEVSGRELHHSGESGGSASVDDRVIVESDADIGNVDGGGEAANG
jgi:hypothetical protein